VASDADRLLDALIDIYDDARNNAPEDRCYVEGAWSETLAEARLYIATRDTATRAQAPDLAADPLAILMHHAADECMSPDQRELFDQLGGGDNDSDVYERLFRCVLKRAPRAQAPDSAVDARDAARYRWLSKRVVITDGSTPGLMVITVVDDGVETTNEFLDEFTEPAIATSAHATNKDTHD
jgi:hypothetical protein